MTIWDKRLKEAISESLRSDATITIEAYDLESYNFLLESMYAHAEDWSDEERGEDGGAFVKGWGADDDNEDWEWTVLISLQE